MTNGLSLPQLREQAIALRRAGKSRREIKEILQITSNWHLNEALKGEPPPLWTRRPNAKDDLRLKARELRAEGLAYNRIAAELGVSKSSISLWVRDLPRPPRLSYDEHRSRQAAGVARHWADERLRRGAARAAIAAAATVQIGRLTERETLIAGAIAYWCEGSKNKPGRRRSDRIVFINSDPAMIKFFMRFLDVAGADRRDLVYRVHIHESADVADAQRYWLELTGADASQFRRPTLKRHRPLTNRSNVGEQYHGCLRIEVRRSTPLYRRVEGWAKGIMEQTANAAAPVTSSSEVALPHASGQASNQLKLPGEDSNLG
jgi:hypothetical protein